MPEKLFSREKYLEDALRFRDTDLVKVVTGVRRCGKAAVFRICEFLRVLVREGI